MLNGNHDLWQSKFVWFHLTSDVLIALTYYSIPVMLLDFIQPKRRDVPFQGMFFLLSALIISCGSIHLLDVWTLWHPAHWLSGWAKAITAVGSLVVVLELAFLIHQALPSPTPTQLAGYHRDLENKILERKQAEEALQASEAHYYRTLVANLPGAVYRCAHTAEWRGMFFSDAIEEICGYPASDFAQGGSRTFASLLYPEDAQKVAQDVDAALSERRSFTREYRMVHANGSLRWVYEKGQGVFSDEGEFLWLDGVIFDITERKQAQQERDRFFSISVDLLCILGLDGYYKRVNPAFETTLGYTKEELLATPYIEFIHPEDRAKTLNAVQALISGQANNSFENRYCCQDGSYKWLAWTGALFTQDGLIYGAGRDITERKQVEEALQAITQREREKATQLELTLQELQRTQAQLVQNEKMVSLGQLVAGVAHEINNPVSFIYGNIDPATQYTQELLRLVQMYHQYYQEPVAEIQEQLEVIDLDFIEADFPKLLTSMKEGASRICQIVLSLRNFSRLDEAECKTVDIHEGIDNTLLILEHRLKQQPGCLEIRVIKQYGQLPKVECYPGQLNQVFMNLLSNAIDALDEARREKPGFAPMIQIQTELRQSFSSDGDCTMDSCQANHYQRLARLEMESTSSIIIRVIDNSPGIKAEVQSRIFDPFFTTKPIGKGTGLGLSISYRIVVDKHGGQLLCHSVASEGTEFVIVLPLAQGKGKMPSDYSDYIEEALSSNVKGKR